MAGRKATHLELINNDKKFETKKALEAKEKALPKYLGLPVVPPRHLSYAAKKEWRKLVAVFKQMEKDAPVLHLIDSGTLEIYCNAKVLYKSIMQELTNLDNTPAYRDMLIKQLNAQVKILKTYGELLLMDPISRARVGVIHAKKAEASTDDEMGALLDEL